jgi:putative acetyltransferase
MSPPLFVLRPFQPADLPALADLWVASWSRALSQFDFEARRPWLGERLAELAADGAEIVVAVRPPDDIPRGFMTLHPDTGYIDQLAVALDEWGSGLALELLGHAKARVPAGLELHVNLDNPRAIRFYEREGFAKIGEGVSERSGLTILHYRWAGKGVAGNRSA